MSSFKDQEKSLRNLVDEFKEKYLSTSEGQIHQNLYDLERKEVKEVFDLIRKKRF